LSDQQQELPGLPPRPLTIHDLARSILKEHMGLDGTREPVNLDVLDDFVNRLPSTMWDLEVPGARRRRCAEVLSAVAKTAGANNSRIAWARDLNDERREAYRLRSESQMTLPEFRTQMLEEAQRGPFRDLRKILRRIEEKFVEMKWPAEERELLVRDVRKVMAA
jgi:hypothetical protein